MSVLKTDPSRVEIEGQILKCAVCGHENFHRRRAQLLMSLPGGMTVDWTEAPSFCLVCDRCGHIEWFLQR